MKLIYIRSTMEPKDYSTLRSLLKQEQGEKIAPYIFKISDTKTIKQYLDKEGITYEIYQEERIEKPPKRTLAEPFQEPRKKRKIE
jgi:hypothetical protein